MVTYFFQKAGIFRSSPLFFAVKAVCQGICLDTVCQRVQVLSPDIFDASASGNGTYKLLLTLARTTCVYDKTHDAYENTWKYGELKLYFSPSAGG